MEKAQTLSDLKKGFAEYIKNNGFRYADGKYRCNERDQIYMGERSIVDDWLQYLRVNGYVFSYIGETVDCGPSEYVTVWVIAILLNGSIETISFQLYPSDWWSEGFVYGKWNDNGEFIEEE